MDNHLSPDQSAALAASPNARLAIVDPATQQRYVLVPEDEYSRLEDLDAIRRAVMRMEAGEGKPLAGVIDDIRQSLGNRL